MNQNRIAHLQPDYLFLIILKPRGWQPSSPEEVPPCGEVLSEHYVASYEEAYDDLIRCNQLSLERQLDKWALIQAPGGNL